MKKNDMKIEFTPDFPMDDDSVHSIEEMVSFALGVDDNKEFENEKKNQRCIIVDIDGTLANVQGGVEKTKKGEMNWEVFFKNIPFYPSNEWCVRLTQIYFQMGFVVYIVTGRPHKYKQRTEDWLAKYGIPYDFLYMRKPNDTRPDEVVKQEILDNDLPRKDLIEFVVDDRQKVVDMWRKNGLTVLQCDPHEFI